MDELDYHQLAIAYCQVVFNNEKPSPKQFIKTYLKAIEAFEKYVDKQYLNTDKEMAIHEIKQNITILDQEL